MSIITIFLQSAHFLPMPTFFTWYVSTQNTLYVAIILLSTMVMQLNHFQQRLASRSTMAVPVRIYTRRKVVFSFHLCFLFILSLFLHLQRSSSTTHSLNDLFRFPSSILFSICCLCHNCPFGSVSVE